MESFTHSQESKLPHKAIRRSALAMLAVGFTLTGIGLAHGDPSTDAAGRAHWYVEVDPGDTEGELQMPQLQNQISQRGQALRMAQNMTDAMDRSTRDLIRNCPSCFG